MKVCATQEETSALLCKVLDGDRVAADLLAKEVHTQSSHDINEPELDGVPDSDVQDLGIWIDPIDGTNHYIKGKNTEPESTDLVLRKGLGIVTVLIGVFDRKTGHPVAGVVNQPFASYHPENGSWTGQTFWGCVNPDGSRNSSVKPSVNSGSQRPKAVISSRESPDISLALEKAGFEVSFGAGAGYKILLVILGCVDVYVTTKTYKWDTCAGNAILCSMGGGLMDLKADRDVTYNSPVEGSEPWANVGLIVAYRDKNALNRLRPHLKVDEVAFM